MKNNIILPTCEKAMIAFSNYFSQLSSNELNDLFFNKDCKTYIKGEEIYQQRGRITGCYFIYSGIIKLYQTGVEGKEQIIHFAKQGDIIGYRSVINQELACTSAKAVDDAILYYIPSSVLINLLKTNSEFAYQMIKITCKELGESNCYITDIAQKSVRKRLAEILNVLIKDFGLDDDQILKISLTREELANMVGTASESVIRFLSEFKREGILEAKGRKLRIINTQKLIEIAK